VHILLRLIHIYTIHAFLQIVWPEDDEWITHFIISLDGVHCRYHEMKHDTLSKNPKLCSHKSNGPGIAYELALHLWKPRLVWCRGGLMAGNPDLAIYKSELKNKIPEGKKAVTDRGYRDQMDPKLAPPNSHDPEDLKIFKARARMRQEHFHSRIKKFNCLTNQFRHGWAHHKICFEAICVICVYEMELVSPLFDL
jgi:hypothetical protein